MTQSITLWCEINEMVSVKSTAQNLVGYKENGAIADVQMEV